jgi:hypothetical protein
MLFSRFILYFCLIYLLLNNFCECQNEIRNAVKVKTNRKIKQGKEKVQHVKNKSRSTIDRTNTKINRKQENTKRKINAIGNVIKS